MQRLQQNIGELQQIIAPPPAATAPTVAPAAPATPYWQHNSSKYDEKPDHYGLKVHSGFFSD